MQPSEEAWLDSAPVILAPLQLYSVYGVDYMQNLRHQKEEGVRGEVGQVISVTERRRDNRWIAGQ